MGATQNNPSKKGASNTPPKAYTGSIGGRTASARAAAEHYTDCDPVTFTRAVHRVARAGGALLLGCTRDGGSLAVTLFWKEERVRFYPAGPEQLEILLENLGDWADSDQPEITYWTT